MIELINCCVFVQMDDMSLRDSSSHCVQQFVQRLAETVQRDDMSLRDSSGHCVQQFVQRLAETDHKCDLVFCVFQTDDMSLCFCY